MVVKVKKCVQKTQKGGTVGGAVVGHVPSLQKVPRLTTVQSPPHPTLPPLEDPLALNLTNNIGQNV